MRQRGIVLGLAVLTVMAMLLPSKALGQSATPGGDGPAPVIWQLVSITTPMEQITPPEYQPYRVQFLENGTVLVTADCNVGSGTWSGTGGALEMSAIGLTRMFCGPESLDTMFAAMVSQVTRWSYQESELVLDLPVDAGTMVFVPMLEGVVWEWQEFAEMDDSVTAPTDPSLYQLQFGPNGKLLVLADCNRGMGMWKADGASLTLAQIATTKMGCPEGSLDSDFLSWVSQASSFVMRDGGLFVALPVDAGIMEFRGRPLTEEEQQALEELSVSGE